MKVVTWVDENGRKRRSMIRDIDGDHMAKSGIPVEAPIDRLDWPALQNEVADILNQYGLLTWNDVQRDKTGLDAALTAFKRRLINLYKQVEIETKEAKNG